MRHLRRSAASLPAVALAAILSFSGGCQCGTPGGPMDSGPLPDGLGRYFAAVCDWAVGCEGQLGRAFADEQSCVAYYQELFGCLLPLFDAFGLTIDPAALDACVDAVEGSSCMPDGFMNTACEDLFVSKTGTAMEGEPCPTGGGFLLNACAPGLYCHYEPGVCSACRTPAGVGQDCTDTECAEGLQCDFTTSTCVALAPNGGMCDFDSDCESDICAMNVCSGPLPDGSGCGEDDDCASGRCAASLCVSPVPAGSPCLDDEECEGFLTCIDDVCAERLPAGAPCAGNDCWFDHACIGGVCTAVQDCEMFFPNECGTDVCTSAEYCDFATSTCLPLVAIGGTCTSDFECVDGAYCDGPVGGPETCIAESGPGGPCAFDSHCQEDLVCTSADTCQPPAANGAPCTSSGECESDYCDGMTMTCMDLPVCPAA